MIFFDPTYLIILPAFIFAMWASMRVNSTFDKYKKIQNYNGFTGAMAARKVLDSHGLYDVQIRMVSGHLSDHYDPRDNTVNLSESVYNDTSVAAIGVACHEVGHAIQYAEDYAPIKIRQAIIPITNIGSNIGLWLFIIGIFIGAFANNFIVAYIGIALFSFTALFQLVTLPTEFNASSRAMDEIEACGILSHDEQDGAKKVLSAAALTYVAALAVSLTQIFRLLVILKSYKDD